MARYYSLDEIRVKLLEEGTKASKIHFLVDECGFNRASAELVYRNCVYVDGEHLVRKPFAFTFGVEMECSHLDTAAFARLCAERGVLTHGSRTDYNHTDSETSYKFVRDRSVYGDSHSDMPCELVSPILKNLDSLKVVCRNLAETGAKVNKTCGLHVHVGAEKFSEEEIYRIVCNYGRVEKAIDSFMAQSRRGTDAQWCAGVEKVEGRCGGDHSRMSVRRAMNNSRYHKVNVMAYDRHKTIEFRQHQGTTNYTKIENWVKFLTALINWSAKHTDLVGRTDRIEDIPFIDGDLKAYFISRREALARA